MVAAIIKETEIRKDYLGEEQVDTIYFGGGTPSLLEEEELMQVLYGLQKHFRISSNAEITLEANPDDISATKLKAWKSIGINRLSIGVQSFFDEDLQWMNRAHNATQALENLALARNDFENITVDLIYGTPLLTDEKWKSNVERLISMDIPHLSCYALTVEQKTALDIMIRQKKIENIDPDKQSAQFLLLMEWMEENNYEHYEISNFARPGYRSRHNSSYWKGSSYLGLGPSAHSFDKNSRQWNLSNNSIYISSLQKGMIPFEKEVLTRIQQLNEYIMTSLRTMEGLHLERLVEKDRATIELSSRKYIEQGLMKNENDYLVLTREGKLLADGIAADLFFSTRGNW